jgi:hypothetical protein
VESQARATLNVQIFPNKFSISGQEIDMALKPGTTLQDTSTKAGKISNCSWIMKEKRIKKRIANNKLIKLMKEMPI